MMHSIPKFQAMDEARADDHWEVRPCGMLVQKRTAEAAADAPSAPVVRIRVKYGSAAHEIYISSQASFGELKKKLSVPTGLHHEDQKILFKGKERPSTAFLDTSGVKDKSKLVVVEDEVARARRCLEMQRNAHKDKAAKSISQISHQVDKLAIKVSSLEGIVSKGKKVAESDILTLTETLMNELLKLDAVIAEGDVKNQRRMQVKRVQKYVEILDTIKIKNASITNEKLSSTMNRQQKPPLPRPPVAKAPVLSPASSAKKWDIFDSLFSQPTSSSKDTKAFTKETPKSEWELF